MAFTDFFFGRVERGGVFAHERRRRAISRSQPRPTAPAGATALQFFDYDNDGLLDLLALDAGRPAPVAIARNTWIDVTARALPAPLVDAGGIRRPR